VARAVALAAAGGDAAAAEAAEQDYEEDTAAGSGSAPPLGLLYGSGATSGPGSGHGSGGLRFFLHCRALLQAGPQAGPGGGQGGGKGGGEGGGKVSDGAWVSMAPEDQGAAARTATAKAAQGKVGALGTEPLKREEVGAAAAAAAAAATAASDEDAAAVGEFVDVGRAKWLVEELAGMPWARGVEAAAGAVRGAGAGGTEAAKLAAKEHKRSVHGALVEEAAQHASRLRERCGQVCARVEAELPPRVPRTVCRVLDARAPGSVASNGGDGTGSRSVGGGEGAGTAGSFAVGRQWVRVSDLYRLLVDTARAERELLLLQCTAAQAFRAVDANADGWVSRDEFVGLWAEAARSVRSMRELYSAVGIPGAFGGSEGGSGTGGSGTGGSEGSSSEGGGGGGGSQQLPLRLRLGRTPRELTDLYDQELARSNSTAANSRGAGGLTQLSLARFKGSVCHSALPGMFLLELDHR
jgi:hypothetical protein